MQFKDKTFNFVVNFLLGVAWASILLGAITSFISIYEESIWFATIYSCIAMVPGMVAVLLLEHTFTSRLSYKELQKQTILLEKLSQKKYSELP